MKNESGNKHTFNIILICLLAASIIMSIVANLQLLNLSKRLKKLSKLTSQINTLGQHTQESMIEFFTSENISSNLKHDIVSLLKIYSASDNDGPLKFIRLGNEYDGGYVVPEKALLQADVLIGYGIAEDPSFENDFSIKYNKPSYGFDCGVKTARTDSPLFTFKSECIADDSFVYLNQQSSLKISSFTDHLNDLKIGNKKIFLKMDIEGAEYNAFDDILKHSNQITGIALEIHFDTAEKMQKAIDLLSKLNKDFALVHVHGNNCSSVTFKTTNSIGQLSYFMELTYINKNLATNISLSKNQSHPTALDMPCTPAKRDCEFKIIPKDTE